MVVMKETLDDCTMLGLMKMVYNFPVMYYLWNEREGVYDYIDYDHLPEQFRVNSLSLKYGLKIISVYIQEA